MLSTLITSLKKSLTSFIDDPNCSVSVFVRRLSREQQQLREVRRLHEGLRNAVTDERLQRRRPEPRTRRR
jgi:hypothetical protein